MEVCELEFGETIYKLCYISNERTSSSEQKELEGCEPLAFDMHTHL